MEISQTLLNLIFFVVSVIFLYKGSDILVEGTSKVALKIGVSSLIISLTIVSYGTSAPEFAASTIAAYNSHTSLSLGNIIGSCLVNLLLILGVSAFLRPLSVNLSIIKRELPILLVSTLILVFFSITRSLDYVTGIVFLILFSSYLIFFVQQARKERIEADIIEGDGGGGLGKYTAFIILGLILVVSGAHLLVESSIFFAKMFGMSEFVIAITMVAIGTSLPELSISAMASMKGESDISLGNLLGSNIFNILLILGVTSIINPIVIDVKSFASEIFLLMVTVFLFPIFYTGKRISRIEGLFLIVLYVIYLLLIFIG